MDEDERRFRQQELDLRREELVAAGRRYRWTLGLTLTTVVVSIAALIFSMYTFSAQFRESSEQFDVTTRRGQFTQIINGLDSSSVAVQVNSIRDLARFTTEEANYPDEASMRAAAVNAVQTLAAFIEDESVAPGRQGLTSYRDPQPIVISRAMAQLRGLVSREQLDGVALDLSRGNFHGADMPDLEPQGKLFLVGADLRMARATGWKLPGQSADLSSSFFTCADLTQANLGESNVSAADFTGANLRGADLSSVHNLTSAQIRGALTGSATKLPPGVKAPKDPWGYEAIELDDYQPTPACRFLVDRMTSLVPGSGYSSRLRCAGGERFSVALNTAEGTALQRVCRLRRKLGS